MTAESNMREFFRVTELLSVLPVVVVYLYMWFKTCRTVHMEKKMSILLCNNLRKIFFN